MIFQEDFMKRFCLWIVSLATIGFALTSCISLEPVSIDETLPDEETAIVYFNMFTRLYNVSSVNGIPQAGTKTIYGYTVYPSCLRVPAGKTIFTGRFEYLMSSNYWFKSDNVRVTADFEAGKTYYVEANLDGDANWLQPIPFTNTFAILGGSFKAGVDVYDDVKLDWQGMPNLPKNAEGHHVGFVLSDNGVLFE
jgi:hypothetical protein